MQAPIAVNGKEVVDLSLRNCVREPLSEEIEILLSAGNYATLLSFAGKVPYSLDEQVVLTCKGKYRYTYSVGGHMVAHTDTMTSPTHIGTLVIPEKDADKGGLLLLGNQCKSHENDGNVPYISCSILSQGGSLDGMEPRIIPIGVLHEVSEVKEGTRISRVYEIHVDEKDVGDMEIEPIDRTKLDLSNISGMITSRKWDQSLVRKYTHGSKFIVYPTNPDPIESIILAMILDTCKVKRFLHGVVETSSSTDGGESSVYFNEEKCAAIGESTEYLHSSSHYNDEGYTTYTYTLANIMEIDISE